MHSLKAEEWQVPIGWWRITVCAAMGVFTRHQWALLPAHKESRARGCAQCESPLRGTAVLSASWQHLVECNTRRSRNIPVFSPYHPQPANSLIVEFTEAVATLVSHILKDRETHLDRTELSAERKHYWSTEQPLLWLVRGQELL